MGGGAAGSDGRVTGDDAIAVGGGDTIGGDTIGGDTIGGDIIGGGVSALGIVETTAGGAVSVCTSVLGAAVTARSCEAMEDCGVREGFAGATSWKPRSSIGADLRLEKPKNCAKALSPALHSSSAA